MGAALVGGAAVAAVWGAGGGHGGAARAGLAISSALFATRGLSYTVRSITSLEQQLNSLQRVVAYTRLQPEEQPGAWQRRKDSGAPPLTWRAAGMDEAQGRPLGLSVEFMAVDLSYSNSHMGRPEQRGAEVRALAGLSLRIRS
eukprot:SAG11_NODE_17044_length_530_cov_0.958237_1_plen_142_part_10